MSRPLSGFSIVRNAVKYGYPVAESLRSLAPLVEELVVAVGRSEDDTLGLIRSLGIPQLRIVETVWDEHMRTGGRVLAQQTNIALAECRHPWALYLQADEVLHEADYPALRAALDRCYDDPLVDALRFRFVHFEGTYGYVNPLRYRSQCRAVRNNGVIESVGDAAGFGRKDGQRLRARSSGARVFHYGWARPPEMMMKKTLAFERLWVDDATVQARFQNVPPEKLGDVDLAFRYRGTHPAVMAESIRGAALEVSPDRRPPLDTPLLNPRFYLAWLRKWRLVPRR